MGEFGKPGSTIAFLIADDFEDSEFSTPRSVLQQAGYHVDVVGTETGVRRGKQGIEVSITTALADADPETYAALVIPGGFSPDHLRTDEAAVAFVRRIVERGVPIAAICHAPSLLIEAGVVEGRTMTSFPSIRTDLRNAGAEVVDEAVVIDGPFITSRTPDDLPDFASAIVRQLSA